MKKKILCTLLAVSMLAGHGNIIQAEAVLDDQLIANIPDEIPDFGGETFTVISNPHWSAVRTYEDGFEIYNFIEKLTNCEIEWMTAPGEDYDTVVQTRLMSGEALDCFSGGADVSADADEGIIVNISDYLDELPLMKEWYEKNPSYDATYAYNGSYYTVPCARYDSVEAFTINDRINHTIIYRKDIAEELGYTEAPATIDEWYNMLKDVKANYPNMIPYAVTDYYGDLGQTLNHWTASWGVQQNHMMSNTFFVDGEGKVQLSAATDNMKAYAMEMNKWYADGLFGVIEGREEAFQGNVFSIFYDPLEWSREDNIAVLRESSGREDAAWTCGPIPAVEGYERAYGKQAHYNGGGWRIVDSGDEERNLQVLKFVEFLFFSKVGDGLHQMGCMGEDSWWFDEEGNYVLAEGYSSIIAGGAPEGHPLLESGYAGWYRTPQNNTMMEPLASEYVEWQKSAMSDLEKEVKALCDEVKAENMKYGYETCTFPFVAAEVSDHIATLRNDINNFYQENISLFISGEKPFSEWDSYVDQLYNDLHLQEVLDAYQNTLG